MIIKEIGSRGTIFTFDDETSVYLVNSDKRLFLCDTHLGPISMEVIKQYIMDHNWTSKELIVFNTHSDWDHIWGNCAFENALIIGHETCRQRMLERGQYDLEIIPEEYHMGKVQIKLPNLTFTDKIIFDDDGVEMIYSPGHTICSSIFYDKTDSVLFTGDLVENPMPFTLYEDLEKFADSLSLIKDINANILVSAHSSIVDIKQVDKNLVYIKNIIANIPQSFDDEGDQMMHENNLKRVMMLKYEKRAKEKLGNNFKLKSFKRDFWSTLNVKKEDLNPEGLHIRNTAYNDLEKALSQYIETL